MSKAATRMASPIRNEQPLLKRDALSVLVESPTLFDGQYRDRLDALLTEARDLFTALHTLPLPWRVEALNQLRLALHAESPFRAEPVDCVVWMPVERVTANDYNPNTVAPPEMELLTHSIREDGYTQPIVSWQRADAYEVVDGFHRNRVARENPEVRERLHGYLPLTVINEGRDDRGDRIAATIRHNRARGKHQVQAMSDIVVELKRRNWPDEKIGRELGMDPDEVLRLSQITGLAEMFVNEEFSQSWDIDAVREEDIVDVLADTEAGE